MFTGLVKEQGNLVFCSSGGARSADMRFGIKSPLFMASDLVQGSSIACSGVCLTLTKCEKGVGFFDVSDETLRCTTLGEWKVGESVNLEKSLRLGDEVGGHLVSGHVDSICEVVLKTETNGSHGYVFAVDQSVGKFIAKKGSVAIDGISLTVNEVTDKADETHFQVNIIAHTYQATTISQKEQGARCNIEIDMLMRYIERLRA